MTFGYDYARGDRESRSEASTVTWHGAFVEGETTAASRLVGLEGRRTQLLLTGEAAIAVFSGTGFDTFQEPNATLGAGLTFFLTGGTSLDVVGHATYIKVEPEQFGLGPDAFPGGGEWLPGLSVSVGF